MTKYNDQVDPRGNNIYVCELHVSWSRLRVKMQMTFPSRPRRLAVKLESPSSLDMGDGDLRKD